MKKVLIFLISIFLTVFCFSEENIQKTIEQYDPKSTLAIEAEGNFTNSGYREIMCFYQNNSLSYNIIDGERVPYHFLNKIICFIVDDQENKIIRSYPLPFFISIPFDERRNITLMPMDSLGESVVFAGYSIGRAGDFNGNGREELYLYSRSGRDFVPIFFEFDPESDEFKSIFEYWEYSTAVDIININSQKKKILFRWRDVLQGVEALAADAVYIDVDVAYLWDEEKQAYIETIWTEDDENTQMYVEAPWQEEPETPREKPLRESSAAEKPAAAEGSVLTETNWQDEAAAIAEIAATRKKQGGIPVPVRIAIGVGILLAVGILFGLKSKKSRSKQR